MCVESQHLEFFTGYPDGSERVRFRTIPAAQTQSAMDTLVADWQQCIEERWVPPLIALAVFNLDFLCIHLFRDGNGRVSRLLWLLQSYQMGYEVGRYISLERLVEQSKARYHETLESSSRGWHEGRHNPWHYINYVLSIKKMAYRDFVERVGETKAPRGEKRERIVAGIKQLLSRNKGEFKISELEQACLGVSRDMVRHVLREQQAQGLIRCSGRGVGAVWSKADGGKEVMKRVMMGVALVDERRHGDERGSNGAAVPSKNSRVCVGMTSGTVVQR